MSKREEKQETEKRQILNYLKQNPTATRSQIAKNLTDIRVATVQRRVNELIDSNRLFEGFTVKDQSEKYNFRFWIMISTRCDHIPLVKTQSVEGEPEGGEPDVDVNYQADLCQEIQEELTKQRWATDISFGSINIVFSAPWDILLSVNSAKPGVVGDFIVRYLRRLQAISVTSTAWSPPEISDSNNNQFDYLAES